jgi:regulator of protease activity HflC (stomatin/prohibitin superfamily)
LRFFPSFTLLFLSSPDHSPPFQAEAQATSILQKAEAHSKAIQEIALAIGKDTNSQQAAQLNLAREYIAMYSDIGQKSNTMIFSDRPGDVNALMNQADAVLNSFKK